MQSQQKKVRKILSPGKILLPIVLGLAVTVFFFTLEFNSNDLRYFKNTSILLLLGCFLLFIFRGLGYIYRIRYITDKVFSWKSSFYVILLWEFGSAVTPTVVGGTAVAVYVLVKEGISLGKSLAYAMLTAILDNLVFIISLPVILFFAKGDIFAGIENFDINIFSSVVRINMGVKVFFHISYSLVAVYTILMLWGLFISPRAFKWLLVKSTYIRFFRKWRLDAAKHGDEIILASKELRGKDLVYWLRASFSTIFIWIVRYLMVNILIAAFLDINISEHILIFFRHIILWIVMLILPTPGGSGLAEFIFPAFFGEFLGGFNFAMAFLWRMFTYYPYLILGAIFIPPWIRRVYFIKRKSR